MGCDQPSVDAAIECQFRVEGQRQLCPIQHPHHLITEVNGGSAIHPVRVKSRGADEHAWEPLALGRLGLRLHLKRPMVEPVGLNGIHRHESCFWRDQINGQRRFEGLTLTSPSVSLNAGLHEGQVSTARICQQNGTGAGAQHRAVGMLGHPSKQGFEQGFVAAGDAHGRGLATRQHKGVQVRRDVFPATAFHHGDLNAQFLGGSTQGFGVLVACALKHGQADTQHEITQAHDLYQFSASPKRHER